MKKKFCSIAALWLALILLVFACTDQEEYLWRFEGSDLDRFVVSGEEAQRAEEAARAAMNAEREEAYARNEAGDWGKEDQYNGAKEILPARGEDGSLNLMWGEYEVIAAYSSPHALSMRVVSAGRQSFIEDGYVGVDAGEGAAFFHFTLTDSTSGVRIACDLPEGARLESVTVHKAGAGFFSHDLAAYAALAGAVLTWMLLCAFDGSERGAARRRDALVIVGTALLASLPLLGSGLYGFEGHDLHFHLNRIEGVASGLRAGQFPVRIHASTLLGYGYASSQFYPELFMYIPALLRNLGVSLAACMRVFEMGINLSTACVCFYSARRIFGSRRAAAGATVLYTLCLYRLANLYVRAAMGEALAMIFFPLLVLSMVEVLTRDEKKWPLLALSMTGVFMSHLLSTLFAAGMCTAAALVCAKRLLREKKRIFAILKAAGLTALCSLWFAVPFFQYAQTDISTSVVIASYENVLTLGSYLVTFPNSQRLQNPDYAYTIGVVPGAAMLLGCAWLFIQLCLRKKSAPVSAQRAAQDTLCGAMLAFGAALLLCATDFFPWERLCGMRRPISTFFMQIQFPWRLVGVAAPLLAMAGAWGYLREERRAKAGMAVLAAAAVVTSGYMMACVMRKEPILTQEDFCDTRITQYEYTYPGTEKGALEPGYVTGEFEEYAVSDFEKRGTSIAMTISMPEGGKYIEVPVLYYPGYHATLDGEDCRLGIGRSGALRIYTTKTTQASRLCIWFEEPALWRAAEGISLIGAAALTACLTRMKRRRAGA